MVTKKNLNRSLSILAVPFLLTSSAFATNRAIVFATTCPAYEQTLDDVGNFGLEAIPQLDALKKAGWDVIPMYGGKNVWCEPGTDPTCIPSKTGRFEQVLKGSSFTQSQFQEASAQNLLQALHDAGNG